MRVHKPSKILIRISGDNGLGPEWYQAITQIYADTSEWNLIEYIGD